MSLPAHPDRDDLVEAVSVVPDGVAAAGTSVAASFVLVVDDDPSVAEALADTLRPEFEVLVVTAPGAALAALDNHDVAVVIADQRMPAMDGVDLLAEARRRHPDVVGVLATAYADVATAVQAINEAHAFGYVAKPWDADELLILVRRAMDAHRARRRDLHGQQQRELRALEQFSRTVPAPVTARRFGATPLREGMPAAFDELSRQYAALIEQAFEQRIYKVDNFVSDGLRGLADRLGALRAGPRDVVELHTVVMRQRLATAAPEQVEAYGEEGRLLILELMGHLVSHYRGYALGRAL